MIVDTLLPISFKGWDIKNKANDYVFWDVNFTKDFGPWRSGEACNIIEFLLSKAMIVEVAENGSVLKSASIELTVKSQTNSFESNEAEAASVAAEKTDSPVPALAEATQG